MQTQTGFPRLTCQLLALGLSSLSVGRAAAENELVSFTVQGYGTSGMCAGDTLVGAHSDAAYFDNGMSSYHQIEHWSDLAVDGRDLTDVSRFGWGADSSDPYGADHADVVFFSGHANSSCSSGSERSWLTMGDTVDGCSINLGHVTSSSHHMKLGNTDANIMVSFACETTQFCVYIAGGYDALTQGEFNLLNGFHGLVYEVSGYQGDLSSYSNDAVYNYVGDAWLDWMYDPNAYGSADNCPTAIGFGANYSETLDFYTNAGWLDIRANGARTWTTYFELCGCDPIDGDPLASC